MEKEEIIESYIAGKSINQLKKETGLPYGKIQRLLDAENVPIRGGRHKKHLSESDLKLAQKMYEDRKTLDEIAQHLPVCKDTLKKELIRIGVYDPKRLARKVNWTLKDDYFQVIDEPNKAYWLGLLFTDGSVDEYRIKRTRLSLQRQDEDILLKFKDDLGIMSNPYLDKREKGCLQVEFSSSQIFDDLAKYGIVPRKTYETIHVPLSEIPLEFHRDFLRGMLDGDGCITWYGGKTYNATIDFCSFHESIVKEFQAAIDQLIGRNDHNKTIFTSCWHCHWRGKQQCLSILDALYQNSERYLQRKYDKYMLIKQG